MRSVTVLMAVHNGESHIRNAVASILRQTYSDFDFLIVDDGSTDGTPGILQDMAGADSRIRVVVNENNLGLAASLNHGLALCDTPYVARMDGDDIAFPDKLAAQMKFLEHHPEVTVCGTWADLFCEETGEKALLNVPLVDEDIRATMFLRNPLLHPTVVYRRDVIMEAGGYNPDVRHAEDYDLWARLADQPKVRFANLGYPGIRYRIYPEERRIEYTQKQRAEATAIRRNLLRKAGFPLQERDVPLLHQLAASLKPDDIGNMLRLAAFSLRLLNWGRGALPLGYSSFAKCVEESVEYSLRQYFGVPELMNTLRSLRGGTQSLLGKLSIKSWALLRKICGKIHPAAPRYIEKLEYCVKYRDFRPLSKFMASRTRLIQDSITSSMHSLLPQEPLPLVSLHNGQPLVSVIITCSNNGTCVEEAIDSVLAQTLKNVEIIVVEGGSTDGVTRPLLESLFKPKTLVLFQQNPTLVRENRNLGIRRARGRYICCLDADDMIRPTYLEKAVFLFETYGYDVVSTVFETFGDKRITYPIADKPTLKDMLDGNHIMACAVFRRNAWDGTPDAFVDTDGCSTHVYEDWRFWTELAARGARMRNIIHEPLFLYRTHEDSLSTESDAQSSNRQKEYIRTAISRILTPQAMDRSLSEAMKYLRCATPGGVLGSKLESSDGVVPPEAAKPVILICMGLILNGGAERLLSTITGHLVAQGWRVVVACTVNDLTENSRPISWFAAHTPEIYQLQRFLCDDEERRDFLRYLVSSRHVDIILQAGSTLLYGMLEEFRAKHPGTAVVDLLFNTAPEGHIASNRKHRAQIDHIITDNAEVKNWLLAHGENDQDVSCISTGVTVPCVSGESVLALRRSLGISAHSIVFGYCGRLSPEKNPLAFVELAHRCRDMGHVYFVMAGSGPMLDAVTRHKEMLHSRQFIFLGHTDEPAPYMAMYDMLVLPSLQDGSPLAIMEAMMLGTPCLAARVGGLPELVEDGLTGILVPRDNPDALEQAVRRMAEQPAFIKNLGSAAASFARTHFDPATMFPNYERALYFAISTRKKTSKESMNNI